MEMRGTDFLSKEHLHLNTAAEGTWATRQRTPEARCGYLPCREARSPVDRPASPVRSPPGWDRKIKGVVETSVRVSK